MNSELTVSAEEIQEIFYELIDLYVSDLTPELQKIYEETFGLKF